MELSFEFEKPLFPLEKRIQEIEDLLNKGTDSNKGHLDPVALKEELKNLKKKLDGTLDEIFSGLTPWQKVQVARHPARPYALDYIHGIFDGFTELHGDRTFGDDAALIGGLGRLSGKSVMAIGIQKGRTTKEKIFRNFGMARPEGYRKAMRLMKMAARFHIPIVTFIDSPGAYPGIDAEERGQAEAIARSIAESFTLEVPIVACIIGEGGSGGALAIGVADSVLMMEYSTYSVISPESCASILWSDSGKYEMAATIMKMTPQEIKPLGVIDHIVREPKGGAHRDPVESVKNLRAIITKELNRLLKIKPKDLLSQRKRKFQEMGSECFTEIPK